MLENFPVYIKSQRQKVSPKSEELKLYQLKKSPIHSIDFMQYALLLQ